MIIIPLYISGFGFCSDSTALVSRKRRKMTSASIPGNLHEKSLDELVALCVSHGFRPKCCVNKCDVIAEIEAELFA